MCCWDTNWSQKKDKGTTAAGQARLEGLCPPVPGRALAPKQETQTHTQTETETNIQTETHTDRETQRETERHTHRQRHTHHTETHAPHRDTRVSNRWDIEFRCVRDNSSQILPNSHKLSILTFFGFCDGSDNFHIFLRPL